MKNDFLKNNYYSPKFKKFITKLSIDTGFKIYFFLFVFFFILCQLSIIVLDDWSEAKAKKESVPYPNKNYKGRWASCVNLDIIGISHSIYTEGAENVILMIELVGILSHFFVF